MFWDLQKRMDINGTEVQVKVQIDDYRRSVFDFDWNTLVRIHTGDWAMKGQEGGDKEITFLKNPPKDEDSRKRVEDSIRCELELDSQMQSLCSKGCPFRPNYRDFKKVSLDFLSKLAYLMVTSDKELPILLLRAKYKRNFKPEELQQLLADKKARYSRYYFVFRLIDGYTNGCLGYQDENRSKYNQAVILFSGSALLGLVYWPSLARGLDSVSNKFINTSIGHELVHQIQQNQGKWKRYYQMLGPADENMVSRGGLLKDALMWQKKRRLASIMTIYDLGAQLWYDGEASFYEMKGNDYVKFDMPLIEEEVKWMKEIARYRQVKRADDVYDNKYVPNSSTGHYYLGPIMAYTIGLALQRQGMKDTPMDKIFVGIRLNGKVQEIPLSKLNAAIHDARVLEVRNLEPVAFKAAMDYVASLGTYQRFINAFATACDMLGFTGELKFIDRYRFNDLCEIALSMKITGEKETTNQKVDTGLRR